MIRVLGLESKRTSFSMTLSGGQKRKLSVGIALIAGSKVREILRLICWSNLDFLWYHYTVLHFFSILFFFPNYMYWEYINKIDFKAFLYTVFWIYINFVCFILGCNLGWANVWYGSCGSAPNLGNFAEIQGGPNNDSFYSFHGRSRSSWWPHCNNGRWSCQVLRNIFISEEVIWYFFHLMKLYGILLWYSFQWMHSSKCTDDLMNDGKLEMRCCDVFIAGI